MTRIQLQDFRNYDRLDLSVGPGINVFFGENGQGKTNLLEAVYLCACARSHRTPRDADLIRKGADGYSAGVRFTDARGYEEELQVAYLDAVPGDPQRVRATRIVTRDEVRLHRIADMMGVFNAVIFAPEDLMLVKEGPANRRRYLDILLSQVRPSYFHDLQVFQKTLQQRNRLLKTMRDTGAADDGQLDVWDLSLAAGSARILRERLHYAHRIAEKAAEHHSRISYGKEKLNVRYRTVSGIRPEMSLEEMADTLYRKQKAMISEDISRGLTSVGPHRDDLELTLDGNNMRLFASQGQQRSAVLALKQAELAIVLEETGDMPVLLLDDVMSELDAGRRASLIEGMRDAQVFVTCTEPEHIGTRLERLLGDAGEESIRYFRVNEGCITPVDPVNDGAVDPVCGGTVEPADPVVGGEPAEPDGESPGEREETPEGPAKTPDMV
ncbi:MAG: DNA replication/repair protein RecF [Clostridia bacterium]|nr:DNA replication/repair protein RecF [Clostridia bacterium]